MAWRDATDEELATIQGAPPPAPTQGFRDATPEELAAIAATPTVKPGDVAARKKQVAEQAAAEQPNVARPRETIVGNALSGTAEGLQGILDILAPKPGGGKPLDFSEGVFRGLLRGVLESPHGRAALGAAKASSAPLTPLSNLATQGGEEVSKALQERGYTTGADVAGALTEAAANVLPQVAVSKIAKVAKPLVEGLKSNRTLAGEAAKTAEADLIAANELAASRATAAKEARTAAETQAAESVAGAKSSAQAATESYQSIGEAAKANIPTKNQIERAAGTETGQEVGRKFKEAYHAERKQRKEASDVLYDEALGPKEAGDKSVAQANVNAQDKARELQDQARLAKTPQEKADANKAFSDFLTTGEVPEEASIRQMHEGLINLKAGQRAAQQAKNDNAARLFGEKITSLEKQMNKKQPGVLEDLAAADANYAKEYAPYFGKKSPVRAIADKDPVALAESIFQPHVERSDRAVRTMESARKLLGNDEALTRSTAHAHFNQLIERASKTDDFRKNLVKEWDKYTNVKGDNNRVLRLGYGKEYNDFNAIVNQLKGSKPKDIDAVVEGLVGGAQGGVDTAERAAKAAMGLAASTEKTTLGEIAKSSKATNAAIKQRLEHDVMKLLPESKIEKGLNIIQGKENTFARRLQSIGSGVFVSGAIRGNGHTASVGGLMVLGANGAAKLIESARGRSLLKAILRGTPGTTQAAATARITENFLKEADNGTE